MSVGFYFSFQSHRFSTDDAPTAAPTADAATAGATAGIARGFFLYPRLRRSRRRRIYLLWGFSSSLTKKEHRTIYLWEVDHLVMTMTYPTAVDEMGPID
jgi:hypothetical protein